jgi:hypothetical protein
MLSIGCDYHPFNRAPSQPHDARIHGPQGMDDVRTP